MDKNAVLRAENTALRAENTALRARLDAPPHHADASDPALGDGDRAQEDARFRVLTEAIPQIVWTARPDGWLDYYNTRWCAYTGLTIEQTQGWGWGPVLHPDDLAPCLDRWAEAVRTGEPYEIDYRFRRADGVYRWHLGRALPLRDETGQIVRWFGTCTDIDDEKRQAADALMASAQQLRAVVSNAPVVLTAFDREGIVTLVEGRGLERLGRADNEAVGSSLFDHFRAVPQILDCARRVLDGEPCTSVADLGGAVFETHYAPVRDADGAVSGAVAVATDVTERVRAEEARRVGEERLRAILANAPVALDVFDADGLCVFSDGQALSPLGLAAGERVGTSPFASHGDRPDIVEPLRRALGGETMVVPTRQGERLFESRWVPLRAPDGQVTGAMSVALDFTDRHRAEEARHASERLLRVILTNIPCILFALDRAGLFTMSEGKALEALGMAPGAVVGMSVVDAYREMPEMLSQLTRALQGDTVAFESRVADRIFDNRAVPYHDAGGVQAGVIGLATDITERVRAEEAHARLAALVEASEDAIIGKALDGTIVAWNGGAERLYGYTATEIVGRAASTLVPPDHPDEMADLLDAVARGEVVAQYEVERVRKDGSRVPISATISPIRDRAGVITGASVVARDITARKQAEAALERSRAELERSNAELQQFAYVASHDLQEPLRTITSYLQLLQRRYRGALGEDADTFIGFAVDGARRMSALIKAVLAYSHVGTHGAAFAPVDSQALVAGVVATLHDRIEETGARVTCGDLPPVWGDATQLGQLVQNLIGNALKFRRRGAPPEVTVTATRVGGDWVLAVRDNGIGLPPDQRERVFGMFQRLHTREEYEGTGIGLSVCQKIVERHGGRIWVVSESGQGATFFVALPIIDAGERRAREREDTVA